MALPFGSTRMIRHWLTIAWRAVRGDPVFAVISLLSLVIGCSAALLVGAYLHQELTQERWMPESARIVRLDTRVTTPGQQPRAMATAPSGLSGLMIEELEGQGLEAGARFIVQGTPLRVGETSVTVAGYYADPNFFDVIPLMFDEGDRATALDDPSGVVISALTRDMLFGDRPVVGETLSIGEHEAVITGVLTQMPFNSAFRNLPVIARIDAPFRPPDQPGREFDQVFDFPNAALFLRADDVKTAHEWLKTLPSLAESIQARNTELPDGLTVAFEPIMLRAIYMAGPKQGGGAVADRARLALFATVGAALLLVSAFNYVSLSLARAVRRTREMGLRKAMGATRGDLVRQHLAESVVFTAIAVVVGFGVAVFAQPWFARTLDLQMGQFALLNWRFVAVAIAGGVVLAILTAAYPAIFLSRLKPASILQGRSGSSRVERRDLHAGGDPVHRRHDARLGGGGLPRPGALPREHVAGLREQGSPADHPRRDRAVSILSGRSGRTNADALQTRQDRARRRAEHTLRQRMEPDHRL
jgi:putative ABC transport system permease protein